MSVKDYQWTNAGFADWCRVTIEPSGLKFAVNRKAKTIWAFDQACDYTAQRIYNDWGQWPLYLCLSGGLDSELVADVLLRNQIPFTPVIVEIDEVNCLETWYAHHWCWRNNVKPKVMHLTFSQYEKQILPKLKLLRHTHNAGSTMSLWLSQHIQSLGGKMITGFCDINFDHTNKIFFNDVMDWAVLLFDDHQHPCGFFCYTPEVAASYINQFDIALDEQYNKIRFYNIAPRPKVPSALMINGCTPFAKSMLERFFKHQHHTDHNNLGNKQEVLQMLCETI